MLQCGRFQLDLTRPRIMAIVNVTPDSFSGDGLGEDAGRAAGQARRAVEEGADIIDVGGESTRPGAREVSPSEELRRVLPVIERLATAGVPISVDTRHPEVMRAAIGAGADMINDVTALSADGALDAVADSRAAVCLMHMRGDPQTMQLNPRYDDVVAEVGEFLARRAARVTSAGIESSRIVLDPGFGFGKRLEDNLALLRRIGEIAARGFPVLVGLSRKSMLGAITERAVGDRLAGSVAAALLAVMGGARIVRVHDVAATRDALAVLNAVGAY